MHEQTIRDPRFTKKLVVGLLFMAFGAAFLLHNMGVLESDQILCYAPLALVALGLERMVSRGFLRAVGGHVMVLVGSCLTLIFLEKEYLIEKWWPLAIVWIGLILTLRALWPSPRPQSPSDNGTFCQDSNERQS